MALPVRLRNDYSAAELRRLAAATKKANQSRRLLSLAAVLDGMTRTEISRQLGNHQDANQILRALSVLSENRKVKCVTERTTGRPAERWFAVGSGGAVQALGCERSELSERSPAASEAAEPQPATDKEVA